MEDAYGSSSWNSGAWMWVDPGSDDAKYTRHIVKACLFQIIPERDLVLQNGIASEIQPRLEKNRRFVDVVGRLKAYEERVKEEDKANDPQENLLYARTGGLLIKVPHSENRLYKAQLKVGKEDTNEVGRESDKEVNPHSSSVTVYETSLESEEDHSRSDGTPIPIARLETIRLLIALAVRKGWKIHHLV
ncbi:hypothetical protein Tco_0268561 [Tanacetum coccineum]